MKIKRKLKIPGTTRKWSSHFLFLLLLVTFFTMIIVPPVYAVGDIGVLSGTITDTSTGKTLDNVFITAKSPSDTFTATTDAHGFFSIAGVPANNYDVTAERVGYQTRTIRGVVVTADATTNFKFDLSAQAVEVQGVTVTGTRAPLVNPRQTMINYGYSTQDIKTIFPGLGPNATLPSLYESLPGVQVSYDAYYGAAAPHIRGGTGSDIGYAFDGVPTYEPISNTFGTNLNFVGTRMSDFYVGAYPPQYGNFLSGYVNQVPERGSGNIHGSIEYQYGFWLDQGVRLPSYNTTTGLSPTYNGQAAQTPTNINIELGGKDRRFSYYFAQLIEDDGTVPYPSGVDIKPLAFDYGGLQRGVKSRDTVLNLTYDLNSYNSLQFLSYSGTENFYFSGFQPLPCSTAVLGGACLSNNTATGFGNTYNAFNFTPLPDYGQIAQYSLAKLEWTHHFKKPGSVLSVRLWQFTPQLTFNYFDLPATFWEYRSSQNNGILIEHQNQLNGEHLLNVGGSFVYAKNTFYSSPLDIGLPNSTANNYFAASQNVLYNQATAGLGILGLYNAIRVPDTQTFAAWASDEWRPSPNWTVYAGLRYDRQNYLKITGNGILSAGNGLPYVTSTLCPGIILGVCMDPSRFNPSQVSPRLGASYKVSDKLTVKSSYGKFITFAPARDVEIAKILTSNTMMSNGVTIPAGAAVDQQVAGAKPQHGESLDVSFQYALNDTTYASITPYIKHILDPLESVTVAGIPTFANAGTIESKGVEFFLKSRDWHNLSGWLSYTYSSTKGSQIPFEVGVTSPLVGAPGSPFTAASVIAQNNQVVPVGYDERHMLSINLNYHLNKWEIAPNFTYGSGLPYGLGSLNLVALSAVQNPNSVVNGGAQAVPTNSSAINPLGETSFNSLRAPGWWLGNLAVTYHFNDNLDGVFNVYNIFNSNQIINYDNSTGFIANASGYNGYIYNNGTTSGCCYSSLDATKPILPQYNPNQGQYAPVGYPSLRQFFLSLRYRY